MIRSRFLFACSIALGILAGGTAAAQQEAITSKNVNLRAGPSRDYPLVAQVPEGSSVQVVGCQQDYAWCDVSAGPDRGWVYSGNLEYPYEGETVPILQEGPVIGLPIVTFSVGPYWDNYYRGRPWYTRRSYFAARPVPHPGAWVRPNRSVVVQSPGYRTSYGSRTGSQRTVTRSQPEMRPQNVNRGQERRGEQRPENRPQAQQRQQPQQRQPQGTHQRPQQTQEHSGRGHEDRKH